jgi:hypothetical protein
MIKYRLACEGGHEFEAWFQSGAAYEAQTAHGQVSCPQCGTHDVGKAMMAPAVSTRAASADNTVANIPAHEIQRLMRKIRSEVESSAEYVGTRFAEEARKIHFEEASARGIYGEASREEVRELAEDGIACFPVPRLPEDLN